MASVNKVILLGHLGQDPKGAQTQSGNAICSVSLATSRKYKDGQGQVQEETEWHRLTFFGRLAEVAQQYLKKGSCIYVEGRLRTRKYTDKEGIERFQTEVVVEDFKFLGSNQQQAQQGTVRSTNVQRVQQKQHANFAPSSDSDDCPF